MNKQNKARLLRGISALVLFVLFTLAVTEVDVRPIGPRGSRVGFGTINGVVHKAIGVNMALYTLTDWLGLVPMACMLAFAALGLYQWIRRGCINRVDRSLLFLGGHYLMVLLLYLFFEETVINCRPVLIDGYLEASYPSSTTLLVLSTMPTVSMQLRLRIKRPGLYRAACICIRVFTLFMVLGRLFSGVHWLTDIFAGVLLSFGMVSIYGALAEQT